MKIISNVEHRARTTLSSIIVGVEKNIDNYYKQFVRVNIQKNIGIKSIQVAPTIFFLFDNLSECLFTKNQEKKNNIMIIISIITFQFNTVYESVYSRPYFLGILIIT
jgi:hypothetical protein